MYIKKIELLNFQVIENFSAEFDGNVYLVTGENELGKSTLLKAIGALLTGERDEVLRSGASKGFARMVVGDDGEEYNVSLSFTENNPRGTLTIKQKSTGETSNNVSFLQRIFGYQDFDAVEFSRWSETAEGRRKQIAVVKALLPEPARQRIETIETRIAELKAERTGVNRDVKTFDTLIQQIAARMEPGDVEKYAAPIDITALLEKQQTNAALIEKAKTVRSTLAQRTEQIAAIPGRIEKEKADAKAALDVEAEKLEAARLAFENAQAQYKRAAANVTELMQERIAAIEAEKADFEARKNNCETWLRKYEENNPEKADVPAMLEKAEAHNKKFSLVEQFKEKQHQYNVVVDKAQSIEEEITSLNAEKESIINGSSLPINGLSFTEEGLELNGIPFAPGKVSDSQQMEVAAKLVIASNPTVKVFRIGRGESLGGKRLKAIVDLARANGFQGFIEQVQRGQNEMLIEEYTEQ